MRKALYNAIAFAKFAANLNGRPVHLVELLDLAELIDLANRAYSAGVREANTNKSAGPARRRFEEYAKSLGLGVTWPGLWPIVSKDGVEFDLPSF